MAREDGIGFGDHFPRLACGISTGHLALSLVTVENWVLMTHGWPVTTVT